MEFLNDAMYSETHEWVKSDGNTATVGITDFAQNELGGVVFVNLPQVGDKLEQGAAFADIESVKAVSDIFSPVNGTVCEINEALLDNPEMLNDAPYSAWLVKVKDFTMSNKLMDCDQYKEFINQHN